MIPLPAPSINANPCCRSAWSTSGSRAWLSNASAPTPSAAVVTSTQSPPLRALPPTLPPSPPAHPHPGPHHHGSLGSRPISLHRSIKPEVLLALEVNQVFLPGATHHKLAKRIDFAQLGSLFCDVSNNLIRSRRYGLSFSFTRIARKFC